ncbi:hypothetical protein Cgig2_022696 [Carnegiea gigantea]|uniref:Photosystem I P700 apoprotein A2 n=1 Tax=Carnegiea gigantea TaxID=171969 RepID=A0A9Q1Q678_9CARY|nr:hypothetical protein Cgig2_022696 [Carnegiea gigantea]
MALRFPRFSQGLAQDPTTLRIWVAWQANFESWAWDPLHIRPIAHAIWGPHFRQLAVETFTHGGALGPVNIVYSVYALMKIFILELFFYYFFLLYPYNNRNENRAFHGSKMLNLASISTCQDSSEMKDLLEAHIPLGGQLGHRHKGLYDTINNLIHFELGLPLASLGVITSLVAQHMYSLPAYAFIAQDFTTQAALYMHHQYLTGFHALGLYIHNDVILAFGTPEKQNLIELIFAQWIQSAHGKTSYGFDALLFSTSSPTFNAGTLDAHSSKLMPDKRDFSYSFSCDGPGCGGTCDISAWDAFYLSSQLINGYNHFGVNSLSVWAWMFLFGHLVWATGFMFSISWHGYWQELIQTLTWAYEHTLLANYIRWKDKLVALSIVLARLVGLAQFSVGYIFTCAAFLITSMSDKFG